MSSIYKYDLKEIIA